MKRKAMIAGIVSAAAAMAIICAGTASGKTSKNAKTFAISGQVTGHLSEANTSDLCASGVVPAGKEYETTLNLPAVKPLKGLWSIEIHAPLGTTRFPAASPTMVTLSAPSGVAAYKGGIWIAGGKNGAGTLKLKKTGGSINLVLPPTSLAETRAEKVVGSWSCP